MEVRHRHEASAMDQTAHMAHHRFGARGNALTFPLPWEGILQALQQQTGAEEAHHVVLPRTGSELAPIVRILLKTNKHGKTSEEEVKSLIHQAIVRRQARQECAFVRA